MAKGTEMIEKVARAICIEDGKDPDGMYRKANGSPEVVSWKLYIDHAKAAISVMKDNEEVHVLTILTDRNGIIDALINS